MRPLSDLSREELETALCDIMDILWWRDAHDDADDGLYDPDKEHDGKSLAGLIHDVLDAYELAPHSIVPAPDYPGNSVPVLHHTDADLVNTNGGYDETGD